MATAPDTALAPSPASGNGTVSGLVGGIINDAQTLAKQQLEMFKAEVREDMNRTRQALVYGGLGLASLTIGGLALLFGLVYLLRDAGHLSEWAAWLIFAAVFLAVGLALGFVARNLFESFNPLPDKTFAALQDNLTGSRSVAGRA